MFDQLYTSPVAIARRHSGPLLKERLAFLAHLANQGYSHWGLQRKASHLLTIAQLLGLAPRKALTPARVKGMVADQCRLYGDAIQWLQFREHREHRHPHSFDGRPNPDTVPPG